MSRSGYLEYDDDLQLGRWRGQVASAIRGRRGQALLAELAAAMDAMPEKELITGQLIDQDGSCCTLGVVCRARGIDVEQVDQYCPEEVGALVGVAEQLAAEIAFLNDEAGCSDETPEQRWTRMRRWVGRHLS